MNFIVGYYPKAEGNMVAEKKEADSLIECLLKRASQKNVRVLSSVTERQGFEPNVWYEGKLNFEAEKLDVLVDLADEISKRLRPGKFNAVGISVQG
jgi:hypothetical protein